MHDIASFGRWLKLRRIMLELSQAELARLVGCAEVTIRKIEADERRPSPQIAERLAHSLELAPAERAAFAQAARAQLAAFRLRTPIQAAAPTASRGSVPVPRAPMIGREQEIAAVSALLRRAEAGLVTLTGPGGIGKTRLALQVAADLRDEFCDGVWFVDLAPVRDPAVVASTIASALGVEESPRQPTADVLRAYLRAKHLLIVLDNVEHLVAAAPLLVDLLAGEPRLAILMTSRIVVGVYGEQLVEVPPLAVPDPLQLPSIDELAQSEAVRLFVARAQAVTGEFALTPTNAGVIAEICSRLEGLPLTIELAAARLRHLPPEGMLARLSSRLTLLTGGARTLPARQQTLRDTLAWSYDLLDPSEQQLFRRLAVFVGGWTLPAAEAVCNAVGDLPWPVLDGLASLIDRSLVRRSAPLVGEPRFTMLETVREYALEQLVACREAEALRAQHAAYYVAFAQTVEPELLGAHQAMWLARLEQEHPNLRAVLEWSQAAPPGGHAAELGLRLATAMWELWSRRGYLGEGRRWLAAVLARSEAEPADHDALHLRAKVLSAAGNLAVYQFDVVAAQALLEESLALFQALDDTWWIAYVILNLGASVDRQGDHPRAMSLLEESLRLFRRLGDRWGMGWALEFTAWGLVASPDPVNARDCQDRAMVLQEEALAHFRETEDIFATACAAGSLGRMIAKQGDDRRARLLLAESLVLNNKLGTVAGMTNALREVAELVARQGPWHESLERAARLYGAAEALSERLGTHGLTESEHAAYRRRVALLQSELGEEAFATAWAEGRAMSRDQAIAYALETTET